MPHAQRQPLIPASCYQPSLLFPLRHVKHPKGAHSYEDVGPCVMMATPSMLQSGLSRDLFEMWCEDPRNTVIIADFAVQGTLARDILQHPSTILNKSGIKLQLRCVPRW